MLDASSVLIVVDVQNSFLPGGSLAVPRGDEIVPLINDLAKRFANVVLTQDWHPAGHRSFASSHAGKKPFEKITLDYGEQILWPDHCVQGTEGASLCRDLEVVYAQLILRKGYHPNVDSYSAFIEADGAAARKEPEPATIRLRVPQGVGGCTLIDGTRVDADADALVAVPPDHVNRLVLAGFTRL